MEDAEDAEEMEYTEYTEYTEYQEYTEHFVWSDLTAARSDQPGPFIPTLRVVHPGIKKAAE